MIEKIQIVHNDFRESLEGMPLESVGRLFLALVAFANDENYTEIIGDDIRVQTIFPTIKAHIERQEDFRLKRANNGKKGGAPIGNTNAHRRTTKDNQGQPNTTKNKQKQTPIPNPIPNPNPNKKIYGTAKNVLLTDDEIGKIRERGYEGLIEELSLYMASKNKKYADHYMTVLAWGRKREKEKEDAKVIKPNQFTQGVQKTEYNYEALEARMVKN